MHLSLPPPHPSPSLCLGVLHTKSLILCICVHTHQHVLIQGTVIRPLNYLRSPLASSLWAAQPHQSILHTTVRIIFTNMSVTLWSIDSSPSVTFPCCWGLNSLTPLTKPHRLVLRSPGSGSQVPGVWPTFSVSVHSTLPRSLHSSHSCFLSVP